MISIQKILPDVGTPLLVGDMILEVDEQKVFEKFHGDPKMFERFISQQVSGIKPFLIQRDTSNNEFANPKEKSPYYPPALESMNDYMPPSRVNPSPSNFPSSDDSHCHMLSFNGKGPILDMWCGLGTLWRLQIDRAVHKPSASNIWPTQNS